MTGRYPPGHGARHNGMRLDLEDADARRAVRARGVRDRRVRRGVSARPAVRADQGLPAPTATRCRATRAAGWPTSGPGRAVVDEALAWPRSIASERDLPVGPPLRAARAVRQPATAPRRSDRRWRATTTRSPRPTRRSGDCSPASASIRAQTLFVVAADHGEAFGEHGEISHSIFVYDTTLRVPLIVAAPAFAAGRSCADAGLAGGRRADDRRARGTAGLRCGRTTIFAGLTGQRSPDATRSHELIYAESFAPLLDFGWARCGRCGRASGSTSPRRSRSCSTCRRDPGETRNLAD